ncbi:unnamed protein product [Orchesella dallaii]|uniref:Uncharacterized protein n=1 Tax=Orchesella dallaii TaxID=48710 RepID=A0ABP1PR83_9HEXA
MPTLLVISTAPSKLYPVDEEAYNAYKERLCKVLPFGGSSDQLPPWSDALTENEIYELAFLNLGHQLTSDAIAQLPGNNLGWKKRIVDLMAYITQTTCESPGLSSSYINAAKNLFLYYILKFEKSMNSTTTADDAASTEEWNEIVEAISMCSRDIEPIHINDDCGSFTTYQTPEGVLLPVGTHIEQFDMEIEAPNGPGMDLIVDNIWWLFSVTYARCYAYFYPNEDVILLFLQRFRDDILSNFANRWRGAGDLVDHFSIIFGPMDSYQEFENVRLCAGVSYRYEGLAGRELVRPLTVMVGNTHVRNFKTAVTGY